MMEKYSKRFGAGVIKKTASLAMSVFFLCFTSVNAQSVNISNGSAYGDSNTVLRAETIQSYKDENNDLDVFFTDTHTISLRHTVAGYINISNNFDTLTINGNAGQGILTSILSPALSVSGGTNLFITGGSYSGGATNALKFDKNAGMGGFISGVQTAELSNVTFSGGTIAKADDNTSYPPLPGGGYVPQANGSTGLYVTNSLISLNGDSSINGGIGGSARSFNEDVFADGGNGLVLMNSSAVISNATIQGGSGGSAVAGSRYQLSAKGGHGIYASGSKILLAGSDLQGGSAGTETQGGILNNPGAGNGLTAVHGSSITASNTTFSGVNGSYAIALQDSDLTAVNSTLTDAGLLSATTTGKTNNLYLSGGTYTSITFNNATNGIQNLTSTNINISADITQNNGTVYVNNLSSNGLNRIAISSGNMIFSNDMVQAAGSTYTLQNSSSSIDLKSFVANGDVNVGLGHLTASETIIFSEGSSLLFDIVSNKTGIVIADSLTFETNSSFTVDASMAGFTRGVTNYTVINTTNGIAVGSNTAPTYQDFTNGVNTEIITTVSTNYEGRTRLTNIELNNDMILNFYTMGLTEYWGNPEGTVSNLADELDFIAPEEMLIAIDVLGSDASLAAIDETYFMAFNSFLTSLQGLRGAVAQTTSRGTEFRDTLNLPKGAKGPDTPESDWRFWGKYYGQFYNRSTDGNNVGFDSTIHGGVFGVDKSFGQLLLGFAGGMGNYRTEYDNEFEENLSAAHALIYTTWGKEHVFIDAGFAYGFNSVETETAAPFTLEGDFDSHLISGYVGAGYGFEAEKIGTIFTPEAGVQYTIYQQDAYTEASSSAVPRQFDDFDADSLQTSLGLNVSMLDKKKTSTFSFKAEGRLHWLHELNPEPGDINFNLENGNGSEYTISYPMLDENAVRIGIGLSFFNSMRNKPENVMFRFDFDELVGENFNSHNLSAKVVFAF